MKMNSLVIIIYTLAVTVWAQSAQAQDASAASPAPIEAFYCNFQQGKSMPDLVQVADRFSKWADKNAPDYSAWILTPQFGQFDELPDVVWLGSSQSGIEFGNVMAAYQASGADIQKAFDLVVDCNAHALASSIEIGAPDGPPGDGVVMFTQCSVADGSDWTKAVAAHKKYSSAMRALGAKNSNWLFFPMLGGSAESDFDYWGVSTFSSWTEYFAAYELYVNGGGWQKGMDALKGSAVCADGTPTVWDVKLVRSRPS